MYYAAIELVYSQRDLHLRHIYHIRKYSARRAVVQVPAGDSQWSSKHCVFCRCKTQSIRIRMKFFLHLYTVQCKLLHNYWHSIILCLVSLVDVILFPFDFCQVKPNTYMCCNAYLVYGERWRDRKKQWVNLLKSVLI